MPKVVRTGEEPALEPLNEAPQDVQPETAGAVEGEAEDGELDLSSLPPAARDLILRQQAQLERAQRRLAATRKPAAPDAEYKRSVKKLQVERAQEMLDRAKGDPRAIAAMRARSRNQVADMSVPVLKDGTRYEVPPGFFGKWVAKTDGFGNPGDGMVQMAQIEGYVPAKDPSNGNAVIEGPLGVFCLIRQSEKAELEAARSPTGGVSPAAFHAARAEQAKAEVNAIGGRQAHGFEQSDHGVTQSTYRYDADQDKGYTE